MMLCRNGDCTHIGKRYVIGFGVTRQLTVLCGLCAESLAGMGLHLRAERDPEPPDDRPRWLRGLRAKDYTGSVA